MITPDDVFRELQILDDVQVELLVQICRGRSGAHRPFDLRTTEVAEELAVLGFVQLSPFNGWLPTRAGRVHVDCPAVPLVRMPGRGRHEMARKAVLRNLQPAGVDR